MFSVFGSSGPLFRGPMEAVQRRMRPLPAAAAPALDPLAEHMDDVAAQPFARWLRSEPDETPPQDPDHGSAPAAGARPAVRAAAAYRQVQQAPAPRLPLERVAQVMRAPAITVLAQAPLRRAWGVLRAARIAQAPVVDGQGQLVGLLTHAPLLRLWLRPEPPQTGAPGAKRDVLEDAERWRAWLAQPVAAVMVSPIAAVHASTQLRRLAQLLESGLPGLPVVADQGDALVGFVSRTDVLRALVHEPPLQAWG